MLAKEEAKTKIIGLVKEFSELTKEDYSNKSENQIKSEFIDPFFEALGWDMRKNADRETQILRGRADYILNLANKEVLIIEAKKADVKLEEEQGRQTVSYGYHRKIKFAVLTNFKQIRVFHALSNIKNVFANQLFWLDFQDFEKNFDKIWLLSRESFEKKELEKLIPSKDQKTAVPIDERILEDLLNIRKWLSNELKNKRMELKDEYIDEVVQIMIDRLIFMRSVEDRGLEGDGFLLKIVEDVQKGLTDKNLWALLKEQFVRFDNTYNSKLFAKGILEEYGAFGDETLKKAIKTLYFGIEHNYEKYMFDKIPGDLFGNIYEQYLGTILAGTEKRVKLDSASGKRKKMGIYYTPSYIVDYIVKNTVGEYIKSMSIDEILEVNIVDPACGSGSFLIRAFKEVCDKVEILLHQGKFSQKWAIFKNYSGKLSFGQKSDILRKCIYGVDLDEKAVELAQLNLLLKVFEGEGRDLKVRKLPNLYENIKNGNSLIDDIKVAGDKAFNWNAQFKEVFDNGGFDVIVGNPPYVDYSSIQGTDYINKNFESALVDNKIVKYNLFQLFIEKSVKIMKEEGVFGFINPNTYLSSDNALSLRKYLLKNVALRQIVDVSKLAVFKEASTYPVITLFRKGLLSRNEIQVANALDEKDIEDIKFNLISQNKFDEDAKFNFIISGKTGSGELLKKIENNPRLVEFKEVFVWGSSITGFATHKAMDRGKDIKYAPVIQTSDIKKYGIRWGKEYVEKTIYSEKLKELFKQKKLVIARVTKKIQATIDSQGYYVGKSSILIPKDKKLFEILLAILNSNLVNFYYKSNFETTHMAGGYLRFDIPYLSQIPIRLPSPTQEKKIVDLVNQMLELQKKYHDEKIAGGEKDRVKQQIDSVDYEIDQEVYKLYGLTSEEIKIVEESLK